MGQVSHRQAIFLPRTMYDGVWVANAPLTTQFFIEDHALRHRFHHLANIEAALGR